MRAGCVTAGIIVCLKNTQKNQQLTLFIFKSCILPDVNVAKGSY